MNNKQKIIDESVKEVNEKYGEGIKEADEMIASLAIDKTMERAEKNETHLIKSAGKMAGSYMVEINRLKALFEKTLDDFYNFCIGEGIVSKDNIEFHNTFLELKAQLKEIDDKTCLYCGKRKVNRYTDACDYCANYARQIGCDVSDLPAIYEKAKLEAK